MASVNGMMQLLEERGYEPFLFSTKTGGLYPCPTSWHFSTAEQVDGLSYLHVTYCHPETGLKIVLGLDEVGFGPVITSPTFFALGQVKREGGMTYWSPTPVDRRKALAAYSEKEIIDAIESDIKLPYIE